MVPFSRRWMLGMMLGGLWAMASGAAESPNECVPNGTFEAVDDAGAPLTPWGAPGGEARFEIEDGNRVLRAGRGLTKWEWEAPGKAIAGAEYVLRLRVRGEGLKSRRFCLWARLPDRHEPPGGPLFTDVLRGDFAWRTLERRFTMPGGVTRFILFFDGHDQPGTLWLDDVSLVPALDRPLALAADAPSFGDPRDEQMVWLWAHDRHGFPDTRRMSDALARPVEPERVLFRHSFTLPGGAREPRLLFVGNDRAVARVDGREVAVGYNAFDIVGVALDPAVGEHRLELTVENEFGPAGLLARVQWIDADGTRRVHPSTAAWECSIDDGASWTRAVAIAAPVPADARHAPLYPQLPLRETVLTHALPEGVDVLRLAARATGGVAISLGGREVYAGASAGQPVRVDLTQALAEAGAEAKTLSLRFIDLAQPPAGQALLQYRIKDEWKDVPLADFHAPDGTPPTPRVVLFPGRSFPLNIGSFETAATRDRVVDAGASPEWAAAWLDGAREIWRIGHDDNASTEFAPLVAASSPRKEAYRAVDAAATPATFPRGLESVWQPEVVIDFPLDAPPSNGALLTLDVEDADRYVCTVGVFANGILCATPQVMGYDQVPGRWTTQRTWTAWIPPALLRAGDNRLTLKLLDPFHAPGAKAALNQSEEYVDLLNLRPRAENPYPGSPWLHWDQLRLVEPSRWPERAVNGRPARLGTQYGYLLFGMRRDQLAWILRDTAWLGFAHTGGPVRVGIWDENQFKQLQREDRGFSAEETAGDALFKGLRAMGLRPFLLFEPGRYENLDTLDENSFSARVIRRFGSYIDALETGNEVDHPYYRFDALAMGGAYATIQKAAVLGQRLKAFMPGGRPLSVLGQGWYHAWDNGVIDAQARRETPDDPAWTDGLTAHSYGKSYIQPAVGYYLTYGPHRDKPLWVTECGSWTRDDTDIHDFELNLRGNLAYADEIVPYLQYPYNREMERFAWFSAQAEDARVLDKARCLRRLVLAHSTSGRPLAWEPSSTEAAARLAERPVLVVAVDAGAAVKIALINLSHEEAAVSVRVRAPDGRARTGSRHADAPTVAEGIQTVAWPAADSWWVEETLRPGEAMEYLLYPAP